MFVCFKGGPKKRPQQPKQASVKPQKLPEEQVAVLPEYDDNESKEIPNYKRTKGIGSSSGAIFISA